MAAGKESKAAATTPACVLLPDTKSSVRWETQDRPTFIAAFKKAGIAATVVNAEGDAQKMVSQADQCLANGAKVVLVTSLDSGSGCKIIQNAQSRGAKVIDYDRLNTGCKGANYYISFDNPTVGKFMGAGVLAAMKKKSLLGAGKKPVIAYLNGGPTDNNSKLFKQGYAGVLDKLIKSGQAAKGPDQGVPAWDNQKARTIFEQMLVKTGNKIDAVAAANDGLANAVVTALKAKKLSPIPVSGQDATAQGAQNIISAGSPERCTSRPRSRRTVRPPRGRAAQGNQAEDERHDEQRYPQRAVVPRHADLDHEGEQRPRPYRADSSRGPRCASARTSSTAKANEPG